MHPENQEKVLEWINRIFKTGDIKDLYVEFPDNQDMSGGFTGNMIIANVRTIAAEKSESFNIIIKGITNEEDSPESLNFKQEYVNEVKLYSEIIPCFKNLAKKNDATSVDNIPTCYGVIVEDGQNIVIMENLRPQKYVLHDIKKSLDFNHILLVLEAYAKWHAFSFALKDQEPELFEDLAKCNQIKETDKMFEMFIDTVHSEINGVLEYNQQNNKSEIIEKLKILKENSRDMFWKCWTNADEDYIVIYHGDCWNNNYLFHYDDQGRPDKVVLIDWQSGGTCSPLFDVTSFLFWCCAVDELKDSDNLLKFYYKVLSEKIEELGSDPEKCFPWSICLKSFKKYVPIAVAAMPVYVRLSYRMEPENENDDSSPENAEKMFAIYSQQIRDPEHYYQRINGILEYCFRRGYL